MKGTSFLIFRLGHQHILSKNIIVLIIILDKNINVVGMCVCMHTKVKYCGCCHVVGVCVCACAPR